MSDPKIRLGAIAPRNELSNRADEAKHKPTFASRVCQFFSFGASQRRTPPGVQRLRTGTNPLLLLKRNVVWLFSKVFGSVKGKELGQDLSAVIAKLPKKKEGQHAIQHKMTIYDFLIGRGEKEVERDGLKIKRSDADRDGRHLAKLKAKKKYLERVADLLSGTSNVHVGIAKPQGKKYHQVDGLKSFMTEGVNKEIKRASDSGAEEAADVSMMPPRVASADGEDVPLPPPPASAPPNENMDAEWVHFVRNDTSLDNIKYRVYLNVRNHDVQHVFKGVVKDILDKPDKFPGVGSAKVCGPMDKRGDSIVIYVDNEKNLKKVLDQVKEYQAKHENRFIDTVPMLTGKVAPGISVGSEPSKKMVDTVLALTKEYLGDDTAKALGKAASFNSIRALSFAICSAMTKASDEVKSDPMKYDDVYKKNLKTIFYKVGIDAEKPYRNRGDRLELDSLKD